MVQVAAVVVAAGQGARAGGDLPKQFQRIAGETLLRRALSRFVESPKVTFVQPVIRSEDADLVRVETAGLNVLPPVVGGAPASKRCSRASQTSCSFMTRHARSQAQI